jgi:hypothetical protein
MEEAAVHNARVRTLSIVSGLLGAWLLILPHVIPIAGKTVTTSATVCGGIVIICAIMRFLARFTAFASWITLAAGAWTVASPWIFGATAGEGPPWSLILSGIALSGLQAYSLTTSSFSHPGLPRDKLAR